MSFLVSKHLHFLALLLAAVLAAASPSASALSNQSQPYSWSSELLVKPESWYVSEMAVEIADSVIQHQSTDGGWPKNTNLAIPPESSSKQAKTIAEGLSTIDNNATTRPMRFIALIYSATKEPRFKQSFERGLQYLLAAQYDNGGWPQYWPLLGDSYYSRVTFNDGAMINVMELLQSIGTEDIYKFVPEQLKIEATVAVAKGLNFILQAQIKQNGRLTLWCAQHHEITLAPAWARAYEPPSLSGSESVGIVRFLMSIDNPSEAVVHSVESAVSWFRDNAIIGFRMKKNKLSNGGVDPQLIEAPAAPPIWARFYELQTNRPLYMDRDSKINYDYARVSLERRNGYAYLGYWPARLINQEYPEWRAKLQKKTFRGHSSSH